MHGRLRPAQLSVALNLFYQLEGDLCFRTISSDLGIHATPAWISHVHFFLTIPGRVAFTSCRKQELSDKSEAEKQFLEFALLKKAEMFSTTRAISQKP